MVFWKYTSPYKPANIPTKDEELQTPRNQSSCSAALVFGTLSVILSFVLGVLKIADGAVFLNSCVSEEHIPYFVLAVGVSNIINAGFLIRTLIRRKVNCGGCMPLYLLVHTALNILESIFVFTTWRMLLQSSNPTSDLDTECSDLFLKVTGILLACGWVLIIMQAVWTCCLFTTDEKERRKW